MFLQEFHFATDSLNRDFLLCFKNASLCCLIIYTPDTLQVMRQQQKSTIEKIITVKISLTTFVFLNVNVVQSIDDHNKKRLLWDVTEVKPVVYQHDKFSHCLLLIYFLQIQWCNRRVLGPVFMAQIIHAIISSAHVNISKISFAKHGKSLGLDCVGTHCCGTNSPIHMVK